MKVLRSHLTSVPQKLWQRILFKQIPLLSVVSSTLQNNSLFFTSQSIPFRLPPYFAFLSHIIIFLSLCESYSSYKVWIYLQKTNKKKHFASKRKIVLQLWLLFFLLSCHILLETGNMNDPLQKLKSEKALVTLSNISVYFFYVFIFTDNLS